MNDSKLINTGRRRFLFGAIPACALTCAGARGALGMMSPLQDGPGEPDKHRFDREVEKKMSRVFAGYGSSNSSEVMAHMMDYIAKHRSISKDALLAQFYPNLQYGVQTLDQILRTLETMQFVRTVHKGHNTLIVFNPNGPRSKPYI